MRAAKRRTSGPYLRKPRAICVYLSGRYDHAVQMDTPESVVEIIPQKIWRSAEPKRILSEDHRRTELDQKHSKRLPTKELDPNRSLTKNKTHTYSHARQIRRKRGRKSWD